MIPFWCSALVLGAIFIAYLATSLFKSHRLTHKVFLAIAVGLYIVTRILSSVVLYGFVGYGGTWDLGWFYGQGSAVLAGQLPYRDFPSTYSPLFPYLIALPLLIWKHPLAINILFGLFDLAVLLLGFCYASRWFSEEKARAFSWQYLLIPFVWLFLVFWNQDEPIASFFLLLAMWCLRGQKETMAAVVLGAGFLLTKVLFALLALPLILAFKERARAIAIVAVVVALGYAPFVAAAGFGIILVPIVYEGGGDPIGASLWVILRFLGINTGIIPLLSLLVAVIIITAPYITLPRSHVNKLTNGILKRFFEAFLGLSLEQRLLLFSLVFMTFSSKSLSFYIGAFAPALVLVCLVDRDRLNLRRVFSLALYYVYAAAISVLYYGELVLQASFVLLSDWLVAFALVIVVVTIQLFWIWLVVKSGHKTLAAAAS